MEITEVRIKLMEDGSERLQGFCSITFDDAFVVRDLKIIEGSHGPFVAMPSRKLTAHCSQCGGKNHLRSAYCNQCGRRLKDDLAVKDQDGRAKLYADIAHPINSTCREMIQNRVIEEFRAETDRSERPDYVSRYDEYYSSDDAEPDDTSSAPVPQESSPAGPAVEKAKVQPAATEPRPPHKLPPKQPADNKPIADRKNEGFGEGIF